MVGANLKTSSGEVVEGKEPKEHDAQCVRSLEWTSSSQVVAAACIALLVVNAACTCVSEGMHAYGSRRSDQSAGRSIGRPAGTSEVA